MNAYTFTEPFLLRIPYLNISIFPPYYKEREFGMERHRTSSRWHPLWKSATMNIHEWPVVEKMRSSESRWYFVVSYCKKNFRFPSGMISRQFCSDLPKLVTLFKELWLVGAPCTSSWFHSTNNNYWTLFTEIWARKNNIASIPPSRRKISSRVCTFSLV